MTEKQTEQRLLMQFIEEHCFIDTKEKIKYPPVALSYGEKLTQTDKGDFLYPIPIGTFGNLSVLAHHLKQRKHFLYHY